MAKEPEDAEWNDSDDRDTASGSSGPPRTRAPSSRGNVRSAIERAWEETSKLAETALDPVVGPTSAFAATAVGWLVTVTFFVLSLFVATWLVLGALILFLCLELLALLAYAYPGVLLLLAVAAGIAPAVLVYWAVHVTFGIDAHWSTWVPFALLLVGAWGSYYYWRFGRIISATGASTLAAYRGAAPKAKDIFGAPFAVITGVWDVVTMFLGVFRGIAGEFFVLLRRRSWSFAPRSRSTQEKPRTGADQRTEDDG